MIRWDNVCLACLLVACVLIAIKGARQIGAFIATIDQIGVGTPEDQIKGMLAVGLIGVIVICIARILVHRNHKDGQS